jgi:hypothetical protein
LREYACPAQLYGFIAYAKTLDHVFLCVKGINHGILVVSKAFTFNSREPNFVFVVWILLSSVHALPENERTWTGAFHGETPMLMRSGQQER